MKRYVIISISAFVIEICSTFYIRAVSEGETVQMLFFAFIGPFLGLPFLGYMIDSKHWDERIYNALALAIGYLIGCIVVINLM
jgi:hypothetical protein